MSTNTNPTLRAVPNLTKPHTETEQKLWRALLDNPGSTAAALSVAAGIGKSTAPKILVRWQQDDLVTRTPGIADGGSRPADRWSITTHGRVSDDDRSAEHEPTAVEPVQDQHEAEGDVPVGEQPTAADMSQGDARPKGERLAPGALHGIIEDYLREHPVQDFTPHALGTTLNRSAGAVHNALEKLVASGYAVRTSDKPKRYALGPSSDDATAGN
ncbi:helix-turn-helix domain-containing protein [Actinosynnema sp. NPDC051121]